MTLSRRTLLVNGAATTAIFGFPSTRSLSANLPDPVADTAQGRLRGTTERGVYVFRGIPYAGSVSGPERRFKDAPPPASWTGIRDATQYGAPSIQPPNGPPGVEPAPAEDCLFLNVWTPATDHKRRPVMFYSHGGGFTVGSGSRPGQNGANLAREHDVVVVESNHRLGIFGYLYLGELLGPEYRGNQGLTDLVKALDWVHRNIASFGGDPGNVMIFGESGGGGKTSALYTMPSAAPFFHKASIESAIGPGNRKPAEATDIARRAMRYFGLSDARRLLSLPADQLLRFQTEGMEFAEPGVRREGRRPDGRDQLFWPMIDGSILPEAPFLGDAPRISADKPLIVGGCRDEAVFFHFGDPAAFTLDEVGLVSRLQQVLGDRTQRWIDTFRKTRPSASPSQLYMAISTASPWRTHAVHLAEQKARQQSAPVYSYILDYQSPVFVPGTSYPMGSPHATDIVTKFDNIRTDGIPAANRSPFTLDQSAPRLRTARNMGSFWASFARTGVPLAPGQPAWKPYDLETRETMLIDAQCRLVSDPEGAERRFWQQEPAMTT